MHKPFFCNPPSSHLLAGTAVCPNHGERHHGEQYREFVVIGHMNVFYVEATGFDIGEETFDPPSFPIKTERVFGCGDSCFHYKQFVSDIFPLKAKKIPVCGPCRTTSLSIVHYIFYEAVQKTEVAARLRSLYTCPYAGEC